MAQIKVAQSSHAKLKAIVRSRSVCPQDGQFVCKIGLSAKDVCPAWHLTNHRLDEPRVPPGMARMRRGGRAVEGARLESVYTAKPYRGFESHPLRQYMVILFGFLWFYVRTIRLTIKASQLPMRVAVF